jgi:hypothetical protein
MKIEVTCPHCNNIFLRDKHDVEKSLRDNHKMYCSKECRINFKHLHVYNKFCLKCNSPFKSKREKAMFCSINCSTTYMNINSPRKKNRKICTKCLETTKSWRHTLCERHWQEYKDSKPDLYLNRTLKEYFEKDSLKDLHPSSKSAHIRGLANSWFKHLKLLPCANCDYPLHVELCHIRAISDFDENSLLREVNSIENIIQLCPNCHWELDNNLLNIEDIRRAGEDRTHINPITLLALEPQGDTAP